MSFDDYQTFTRSTALYPGSATSSSEALAYCAFGIAGEAGEISEKLKKIVRVGGFKALGTLSAEDRGALLKEVGDVMWYLARFADELGQPLSEVIAANVAKLTSRKDRGVIHGSGDER
jgi:NTP pyrophosphatase (non-canonical NTP hydrolase)